MPSRQQNLHLADLAGLSHCLADRGWQFFQLSGPYKTHSSHQVAYPEFAAHVEEILQGEVDVYLTQIMRERKGKEEEQPAEPPSSGKS